MDLVEKFLPLYPNIEEVTKKLLTVKDFKLLESSDEIKKDENEFKSYQLFVQRYLSPLTPYKYLLLNHDMGSGKSCSAFLVAYSFLENTIRWNRNKKILVVAPNNLLCNNLRKEFSKFFDKVKVNLSKNKVKDLEEVLIKNIEYNTFSEFVLQTNKNKIVHCLVIIDEVHQIHLPQTKDVRNIGKNLYFQIKFLLKCMIKKNVKVLLMTGTPITNAYTKVFQIIDLLIENDKDSFNNFEKDYQILKEEKQKEEEYDKEDNDDEKEDDKYEAKIRGLYFIKTEVREKELIVRNFLGRVSSFHILKRTYENIIENGNFYKGSRTKVYKNVMVGKQREKYLSCIKNEKKKEDVHAFFVFPSITFNEKVYSKFDDYTTGGNKNLKLSDFSYKKVIPWENGVLSFDNLLSIPSFLKEHSILYYNVLKEMGEINDNNEPDHSIKKKQKEAVFYFNERITNTGNKMFSIVLESFGFEQLTSNYDLNILNSSIQMKDYEKHKKKRFAVVSSDFGIISDEDIKTLIDIFSDKKNRYGEFIRIIVGSKRIAMGYNLINGRQSHATIQWNSSIVNQAQARVLRERTNFDDDEKEERYVKLFKHIIVLDDKDQTVDTLFERRLKSTEEKEDRNAKILHLLDSSSVDCSLNKNYHSSYEKENNTIKCNLIKCSTNFTPIKDVDQCKSNNDVKYDNTFLHYKSKNKYNIIKESLKNMFQTCESFSLEDFILHLKGNEMYKDVFFKLDSSETKWNDDSNMEIFIHLLKIMKNQLVFEDRFKIKRVIGYHNNIIFLKKTTFIKSIENVLINVLHPFFVQKETEQFEIYINYYLKDENSEIKDFINAPTENKYNKLNIFTRLHIFENIVPIIRLDRNPSSESFNVTKKHQDIILKCTKNQYLSTEKIKKTIDFEIYEERLYLLDYCYHIIMPDYVPKNHTIRKEYGYIQGLRAFKNEKWISIDTKNIQTYECLEKIIQLFDKQESKKDIILDNDYPFEFFFLKELEGDETIIKKYNVKKIIVNGKVEIIKKKGKGQNCETLYLSKEDKIEEYINPHIKYIESLIDQKKLNQINKTFELGLLETVEGTSNIKVAKAFEQKCLNTKNKDEKCVILYNNQKILFPNIE
uniref:Helicase ATP-binding domain-containing protein n=1 Tax=viral metagenome TaxID=1070528 RepID=A0A6C0JR48_9ZZZZ